MLPRRDFIRNAALGTGALLLSRLSPSLAASRASSSDSNIEILLDEPLGTISPNIYGHFTEDLSGVIYDGVWVGKDSKVPNIDGIRKELVEQMRRIHAPIVRYPGGCFADSYGWRDGIGPADKRPRRTNFWAGGERPDAQASHKYDPNQFGTDEFARFCKLIGAQPYLAANVRSLPPEQFDRWVEYCNSPAGSTTLAGMRAASGYPEPFDVRYWGIGNESWGCGGNFTPQEYAVEFRRFTTWVPGYGVPLSFIASGPDSGDWSWTRGFLEGMVHKGPSQLRSVYGLSLHYYTWNLSRGRTESWTEGKADALNFEPVDWYELLRQGEVMQSLIDGHWEIMGEFDKEHHIKLVVDEWGPWYKPGSEITPEDQLEQMPTLRDAVFSGMTLDIFNRNPEKVAIAACAQLINCLNSLYLAHENQFCVTPVGHIFQMYAAHQGGQSLRTIFLAPDVHYDRDGKPATFWGLKGSASLHDKELVLTVVNSDVSQPRETAIRVRGAAIKSGTATVLTAPDIHAHNTFGQPDAVVPASKEITVQGPGLTWTFPPASVTKLTLSLE
jgi:alpha-L-arabinofuranosidase